MTSENSTGRAISAFSYGSSARPRKKEAPKNVINPIFAMGAQTVEDIYWQDKLNQAAMDKFPQYFYYNYETLTYKKGTRKETITIANNPVEAASAFIYFLREHGYFSPTDNSKKNNDLVDISVNWAKANKILKSSLLNEYISNMSKVMKFNRYERQCLRQILFIYTDNGVISSDDIQIKDRRIFKINGLAWDSKNGKFKVNKPVKLSKASAKKKKDKCVLLSLWNKRLQSFTDKTKKSRKKVIEDPNDDSDYVGYESESTTALE